MGSRGQGGFTGDLLGPVSQDVVADASCPVVLVPDPSVASPGPRQRTPTLALRVSVPPASAGGPFFEPNGREMKRKDGR